MSNFLGGFASYSVLPPIDGVKVFVGDFAYTVDGGGFYLASQPSAPPGALPVWDFIDTLRGAPGPQGEAGVSAPGSQGPIGPVGTPGQRGPAGPPGRNLFSNLVQAFQVPDLGTVVTAYVTDTSWMTPGELIYLAGAGTFTVIGTPVTGQVQLANSGDPANQPIGTIINAGAMVSPASQRGPTGPAGTQGPIGPPGPQGVSGASVYSTLSQVFAVPAVGQQAVAFVLNAASFGVGQIVFVSGGDYMSVQAVNPTNNTLTLQNMGLLGTATGTSLPVGATVSGTGPQGPMGVPGPQGPMGLQGPIGVAPTGAMYMWPTPTAPAGYLLCQGQNVSRSQYPNLFAVISTTFGNGDGSTTFGLPDMRGRVPRGVSATYPLASTGGEATHILSVGELAVHNHNPRDTGHAHVVPVHGHGWNDNNHSNLVPAHGHGFNFGDPGHLHQSFYLPNTLGVAGGGNNPYITGGAWQNTTTNGTGLGPYLSVAAAGAFWTQGVNVAVGSVANAAAFWDNPNSAAIVSDNIGGGVGHNNLSPYLAINYVIKV